MEVYEAIQKRKSIRKFKPRMVPNETIHRLLEAGTYLLLKSFTLMDVRN